MEDIELTLSKAIEYRRLVRIIYEKDGEFTERVIRPSWIRDGELGAYCYMRHAKRRFHLENIIGAVMLPEKEGVS